MPGDCDFLSLLCCIIVFIEEKNIYFNETAATLVPRKSISKKELTSLIDSFNDEENAIPLQPVT